MFLIDIILGFIVVLTLALLLTIVLHLFFGVPYVPTPPHIVEAMIGMVPWKGNETVLDLGAGDGRLLIAAKKNYPGIRATGYEVVPTVWLLGVLRSLFSGAHIRMRLRNCLKADVSSADVVFLYLFPSLMEQLARTFDEQLKDGCIVVTHTFGFNGRTPEKVLRVPRLGGEVTVFLYRWKRR